MSSEIKVINNSKVEIQVSVTARGGDQDKGGSEQWYTLAANGGTDTWKSRKEKQVVRFVKSVNAGASVEVVLGVPGETVQIY